MPRFPRSPEPQALVYQLAGIWSPAALILVVSAACSVGAKLT